MKLKRDANGNVVLSEKGHPIYVKDDGSEIEHDAAKTLETVSRLFGENRGYRERAETAETKLKGFEGIEDPTEAKNALEKVKNLTNKEAEFASKLETVRNETAKALEQKYAPIVDENGKLKSQIEQGVRSQAFTQSDFVKKRIAENIPADLVEARFGSSFKQKDGKLIGYRADGSEIYSQKNPGNVADFDEALEIMVMQHPMRDSMLRGTGQGGSGSRNNGQQGAGGKRVVTRTELAQLSPAEQATTARDKNVSIVDG